LKDGMPCFEMHLNKQPIGHILWFGYKNTPRKTAKLDHLYILPKFRKNKRGTTLITAFLDKLKGLEFVRVQLNPEHFEYADNDMDRAEVVQPTFIDEDAEAKLFKFYASFGFKLDPQLQPMWTYDFPVQPMTTAATTAVAATNTDPEKLLSTGAFSG
jgi:GNAT superfamily N-acetyltransferase